MSFSREQRRNLVGLFYGELTLPAAKLASATITSSSNVAAAAAMDFVGSTSIGNSSSVDAVLTGTFVAQAAIDSTSTLTPFGVVLEGSGNNVTKIAMYYRRMRA